MERAEAAAGGCCGCGGAIGAGRKRSLLSNTREKERIYEKKAIRTSSDGVSSQPRGSGMSWCLEQGTKSNLALTTSVSAVIANCDSARRYNSGVCARRSLTAFSALNTRKKVSQVAQSGANGRKECIRRNLDSRTHNTHFARMSLSPSTRFERI